MSEHSSVQEYKSLFKKLLSFRVLKDLPKINRLLFGGVDAGKSSLISTVDSLFKGRMSRRAAHGQGTGSYTRALTKYSFKATNSEGAVLAPTSFHIHFVQKCKVHQVTAETAFINIHVTLCASQDAAYEYKVPWCVCR